MTLTVSHDDIAKTHEMMRRLFLDPESGLERHWTDTGMYRPGYSERETEAINMVAGEAEAMGMEMVQDVAGNVFFIYPGADRSKPVNMIGSHLDAVPNGGRYDGPAGVVGGLAAIKAIHEKGVQPQQDIVLAVWRNEESPWFGQWGLGSAIAFGLSEGNKLGNKGRKGNEADADITLESQMKAMGLNVDLIKAYLMAGKPTIPVEAIASLSEIHIKQDTGLRDKNVSIGFASAIRGNVRFPGDASFCFEGENAIERGLEFVSVTEMVLDVACEDRDGVFTYPIAKGEGKEPTGDQKGIITFIGEANHSGSTPQEQRKDAVRAGALFRTMLLQSLKEYIDSGKVNVTFTKAYTPDNASATTIPAEFNVGVHIAIEDEKDRIEVQTALQHAMGQAANKRQCDVELRGRDFFATVIQGDGSQPDVQSSFIVTPETRSTEGAMLDIAKDLYTSEADRLGASYNAEKIVSSSPSHMSEESLQKCMEFAREGGIACAKVVSGAGHDVGRAATANTLHDKCDIRPTLIFCRHDDARGLSHNPAEMLGRDENDDPFCMKSDFHNAVVVAANLAMRANDKTASNDNLTFAEKLIAMGGKPLQFQLAA